jgi:cytochrome P450
VRIFYLNITQEIVGNRARFPKPVRLYKVLDLYGPNLVTTENEEWRVHRKIAAPSFSEVDMKSIGAPAAMLTKYIQRVTTG